MKKYSFLLLFFSLLLSSCSTLSYAKRAIASVDAEMEYVSVCDRGNNCKKFSRLIMGTDHLIQANWTGEGHPEMTAAQIHEVLDEAAKLGINLFDSSPVYVNGVENELGKWLNSRKKDVTEDTFYYNRNLNPDRQLYALSKGGFPFDLYYSKRLESGTHSPQLKNELLKQGILKADTTPSKDGATLLNDVPPGTYASRLYGNKEQITKRISEELGHSYSNLDSFLTIYLMHRDDGDFIRFNRVARPQTPVKTIMEALGASEISKRFWLLGWSNWETERVNESIELSSSITHLPKPTFNSSYFSLFEMSTRTIHAGGVQVTHPEMNDPSFQKGIKQNSYSPLGGFSILDKPEPRWENAKKSAKEKFDAGDAYWLNVYNAIFTDANQARYDRVVEFTKKFNKDHNTSYTLDQMINAYALAHKRTDFLTVGPITVDQLKRTVASLKLSRMLTNADLDYLYRGN